MNVPNQMPMVVILIVVSRVKIAQIQSAVLHVYVILFLIQLEIAFVCKIK